MTLTNTVCLTKLAAHPTWWAALLVTLRTLGVRAGAWSDQAWEAYNAVDSPAASAVQLLASTIC